MMNYKETLFFVAKCLTINHEEKNKILVEKELKSRNTDWDSVVKLSTGHFVFPALYCNLKRANFLHYLPEELVNYMIHITDLNRARNQQIIDQAKEINELLLKNNITPIFLKGTGNLLEGLYEDIGERMVGDIDLIVSKDDFKNTVEILKKEKYSAKSEVYMDFHWHYPKMVKENRIAAVEVHNKVLKKPYTSYLDYETLKENSFSSSNCSVASFENQFLITILQKQINDNLYFSKTITLRNVYDSFLLSINTSSTKRIIKNKTIIKYLNNYKSCASEILNAPKTFEYTINSESKKYIDSYLKIIGNSKKELRKIKLINSYIKIKDKIKILQYSFIDKEYSKYTFRRFKNVRFYLKQFGLDKTKPNS
ncbi:nucleotidyltransferase family protein [Polaribacter sp. L3A8]|uniref:nucleotidyltransferase family protein n=1 Tax=Polaribacter sp. L3A8 TaxID=2686361 RepID=UPI00131C6053|nr:nucleotidyltransferase family protein [Polaribacter sp. L3A8]